MGYRVHTSIQWIYMCVFFRFFNHTKFNINSIIWNNWLYVPCIYINIQIQIYRLVSVYKQICFFILLLNHSLEQCASFLGENHSTNTVFDIESDLENSFHRIRIWFFFLMRTVINEDIFSKLGGILTAISTVRSQKKWDRKIARSDMAGSIREPLNL